MGDKAIKDLKLGLVLAGGGAKGAYEAGVFKTLWELDLVDNITVISGTSVGAVNALLFSMNNRKVIKDSWSSICYGRFMKNQELFRKVVLSKIRNKMRVRRNGETIEDKIRESDIGLLSQKAVQDFIEEYVTMDEIRQSDRHLYACAYNIDEKRPEYFCLNDYKKEEMLNIVLASCAIPVLYSPIVIDGNRYADGGIHMPEYKEGRVDNVPIQPLREYDCDYIIVIHLSNKSMIERDGFEKEKLIEIYPSQSIEFIKGAAGVNLRQRTLAENIELGYRDSMIKLAPLIVRYLKEQSEEN